jgi:hypothetical protein
LQELLAAHRNTARWSLNAHRSHRLYDTMR